MNKITPKIVYTLFLSLFILGSLSTRATAATNICRDTGTALVFFNGLHTTPSGANRAKEEFRRIHGEISTSGDAIRYEVLYNYSAGFEDFVTAFEQRLQEQEGLLAGRFELFFEALSGNGLWWSNIINSITPAVDIFDGFVDWSQASTNGRLTTLLSDPPTIASYAEHKSRIDTWILEGKKLLFVAHSQGNLFANAAYEYAITKVGAESVKVVHIAPVSGSLYGNYILADLDLVSNGLHPVESMPQITNDIPGYLMQLPGVNGRRDPRGHGLLEIYINPNLTISDSVREYINIALNSLIAPPREATSGFFTATLTWDGTGDVDLHTFEPNDVHVYYSFMRGTSGYLDVDNTRSYGPEHYYASCDANKLQTGTYRIAVANYARADGRKATVQISSANDGVLGTKSVVVAEPTGNNPVFAMFNVVVAKNEQTGKYSVSIE